MYYVIARNQETNFFTRRDYQRLSDFAEVMFAFRRAAVNFILRSAQFTHKLNAFADVLVLPLPLVTSYLNIDISIFSVIDFEQCCGRRNGHNDQNDGWNNSPNQFNNMVFVEVCRHSTT